MTLVQWSDLSNLDAMILAIPHQTYQDLCLKQLLGYLGNKGIIRDVKSVLNPNLIPSHIQY
ncbi:hypothetical protein PL8927_270115 [Planktothrix serta PCC 8927]|uniref:Uncharacterized protein n=1 Tax=Planktothrix serta PCC 8927 TaxID=671068 RepID=A0A7Z9DVM3_9CYAN|nr:hypothetical protein PL8927_270115 [Planktothrix serta PCC 8927]